MFVFISYGHDPYKKLAFRIKDDLEKQGYNVWIDTEGISDGSVWQDKIESGITKCDWFLLLMTQHSCRRPEGVCLDEVSFARNLNKKIYPVMIESVNPPLCVARVQYLDMERTFNPCDEKLDDAEYQKKLKKIIDVLENIEKLEEEGDFLNLRNYLTPLDNDVYYDNRRGDFYGRERLIKYCEEWISGDDRILWLVGDAGIGKSSFVAKLTEIRPEIKAVHFCKFNDNERSDAKRAIMSLAYYLSTQVEAYKEQLLSLSDLSDLKVKNVQRLFDYLIVEPLGKIPVPENKMVIIIDALDESLSENGSQGLVDVISNQFLNTPEWLKLIITSRRTPDIDRRLSSLNPIDFADSEYVDNNEDLKGYFGDRLEEELSKKNDKERNRIVQSLAERSEGIFQYAISVVEDVKNGNLSLDNPDEFPKGLIGVYYNYFERLFGTSKEFYKERVRPLVEVLCAECEPLEDKEVRKILNYEEYAFLEIKESISQMFPEKNGRIEPIHKSIFDWLTDKPKCGDYFIDQTKGHSSLAKYCVNKIDGKKPLSSEYVLRYGIHHLLRTDTEQCVYKAVDCMNDAEFQRKRIKKFGVDTGIRIYIYELKELSSLADEFDVDFDEIFLSEIFIEIFTKYRIYFYNSGLYFNIEELGFNDRRDRIYQNATKETKIGLANYCYITEHFDQAIRVIEDIFSKEDLNTDEKVELSNLIALCYRKYARFSEASAYFEKGWESGEADECIYAKSISAVNLAKIAYHKLDWRTANDWNAKAIEYLSESIQLAATDDERVNRELFLAEYHRLVAESVIWNYEVEDAESNLKFASDTYTRIASRDRYFIRYLYTTESLNVLKGNYVECVTNCTSLMDRAVSKYDKSQICFYKAMSLIGIGNTQAAQSCIDEGIRYADDIDAWLEREELITLGNVAIDASKYMPTDKCTENSYIAAWVNYEKEFIHATVLKEV